MQYLVDIDPTLAAPVTKQNTATVTADGIPAVSDNANIDIVEPPSEISTTKTISTPPSENADGTWTFTYTISVANTGGQDLTSLQVTDDLGPTFPAPVTYTVDSVSSPDFAQNPAFDGIAGSDTDLLLGTDPIAVGEFGTILLTVTIDPNGNYGPYANEAIASGDRTRGTGSVTDASQDLPPIDADGDGIPDVFEGDVDGDGSGGSDDDEPTLLPIPEIGLYKDITAGPTYDLSLIHI